MFKWLLFFLCAAFVILWFKNISLPPEIAPPKYENMQKNDAADNIAKKHDNVAANGASIKKDSAGTQSVQEQLKESSVQMDVYLAGKILDFHNYAVERLNNDYSAYARMLAKEAQNYFENWKLSERLPKFKKTGLMPSKGLFNEAEEQNLAESLLNMDKALEKMGTAWKRLLEYIKDESIQDDGKQGKKLAESIGAGYEQFLKARRNWLNIAEKRASQAETAILAKEPLQRQILAANSIFNLIEDVSDLIIAKSANRQEFENIAKAMDTAVLNGEKPPFPAKPAIERLYREFLQKARIYNAVLKRSMDEGIFAAQQKELANAAKNCRESYNLFAKAVNNEKR